MSTTPVIALQRVVYKDAEGNQAVAEPGSGVFHLATDLVPAMVSLGSVREASPLDHDGDGNPGGSVDDLDQMKVGDLKVMAELEGVDLGSASRRDDILLAIRQARIARAAEPTLL